MKINRAYILVFFLLMNVYNMPGQDTKAEYGLYNTALGSVAGGIGALINKKPDEKWGRVLVKGLWQGALGGFITHESKLLVGKIGTEDSFAYSWYGKLANSAGNSIIENASMNRNFYDQWNVNFGFNRIELHTKDKLKVKYKIMPVSLFMTAYVAFQSKFEFEKTLQTGELIFSASRITTDIEYDGMAIGNVVVMQRGHEDDKYTYAHEFVHVYQYYDFNFVNSFLDKPVYKITNKWFGKANGFIYYDLQAPFSYALYFSNHSNDPDKYYNNFFEREAAIYSKTLPQD